MSTQSKIAHEASFTPIKAIQQKNQLSSFSPLKRCQTTGDGKMRNNTLNSNDLLPPLSPIRISSFRLCQTSYNPNVLNLIQTPCRPVYSLVYQLEKDAYQNTEPIKCSLIYDEQDQQSSYSQQGINSEHSDEQHDQQDYIQQEEQKNEQSSKEFLKKNISNQNNIFNQQKLLENLQEQINQLNDKKYMPCNCKKTQCLKLYCDCFREGRMCGQECNCVGCHNEDKYKDQIQKAKQLVTKRDKFAFQKKIIDEKHSKGCNCKKSGCQKKYCQCYQANLKCNQSCRCEGCLNCNSADVTEGKEHEGKRDRRGKV